jgi:hypothetical protein
LSAPAGPPNLAASNQEVTPLDPVALAYNPADGGLLKADSQGLFGWHPDSGWRQVDAPQHSGLSGVAINPDRPDTIYWTFN